MQDCLPCTVRLFDCDVFDEQAEHSLAIAGLRRWRVPQARQILRKCQYFRFLLGRRHPGLLLLKAGVLFFEIFEAQQAVIPAPLEC